MVRMTRVSAFREISASDFWGKTRLAPLTLVILGFLQPAVVLADDGLPQGGSVAHGRVGIATPGAGSMVITQVSDRAIVNWDSFSIGQGNSVSIYQPSTSSAILNRVTGDTTSQIHGQLTATGQVFVVNPNGLFIGAQGDVSAGGGFVGSSLDTADDDFTAGQLRFDGLGSSAPVENAGRVAIGRGGFAALLGGRVSNSGIVTVPMGRIGFAAGELVTLDVSGDQFLQVAVPSQGNTDEMRALIENSGTASANGGQIEMRAATARDAARNAINLSGVAEARSVSTRGGMIVLGGGGGGAVHVTGRVTTRASTPKRPAIIVTESARPNARPGGNITITGRDITLQGANIATGGNGDGGSINIGGAFQGGGTLPSALYLGVDVDTVITADAGQTGDGGRVILWSDIRTDFDGQISARAGTDSGDGGFVEVSGKQTLAFSGLVDTRAPQGATGTLLLDPYNITIADEASSDIQPSETGYSPNGDDAILSVTDLEANLATNNVTVSTNNDTVPNGMQDGDITVASEINWTSSNTLTFEADNDVILNAGVDGATGTFEITAGGVITTGPGGFVNVGRFNLNQGNWVQVGPALPDFYAGEFRINAVEGASFLRATGGTGSAADPYQLTDIFGVQGIGSQALLDQSFALDNDIDATETANWNGSSGFAAIGESGAGTFTGTLDGQGNTITGLTVNQYNAGMFETTGAGAEVSDLNLAAVAVSGNGTLGALVATASGTTIDSVTVSGSLAGGLADNVGGIVGVLGAGSSLTNSSFLGTITSSANFEGSLNLGGLVGASFGTVENSAFDGTVSQLGAANVQRNVGGAIGLNQGAMTNVTAEGTVQSNDTDGTGGPLRLGGLVGYNGGNITDSQARSAVTVASSSNEIAVGGLIGLSTDTTVVSNVTASGDVTVTSTTAGTGRVDVGGLIGESGGTLSQGNASGDIYVSSVSAEASVGGFVGRNRADEAPGDLSASIATGDVELVSENGGSVGGFAGYNSGSVTDAIAEGNVDFNFLTPPEFAPSSQAFVGGFAGVNQGGFTKGTMTRTAARGNVSSVTAQTSADVGGHTGFNASGNITDSYANGDVSATSSTIGTVGGLIGRTSSGSVTNTYASGDVNADGGGGGNGAPAIIASGGLIGQNTGGGEVPRTTVTASYWDTVTSGQADGGDLNLGLGLTTQDFEDTDAFFAFAQGEGWNFDTVWAPGAAGRYPSIYTIDRVVFAQPDGLSLTYGDTPDAMAIGSVAGGPALYVFAEDGETLDTSSIFDTLTFADNTVGVQTFTVDTSPLNSSQDQSYAVVAREGNAVITPAALTLTANDATSVYGTGLTFDGTEFLITAGGLFFDDSIDTITLTSAGAADTAQVTGSPYVIAAGGPVTGTGTGNYAITYVDGALVVTPARLTLTANDATSVYGTGLTFVGTEFTADGLLFDDSVDLVALDSEGAAPDAPIAGSPYGIVIEDVVESNGLDNYDVTFVTGTLTVGALVTTTPNPYVTPIVTLPNPSDTIVLTLPGDSPQTSGTTTGSNAGALGEATETLVHVQQIASTLEIAAAGCNESSGNVDRYLACLSDALDDFANELDEISTDLPAGMQDVARIVRDARQNVSRARARAKSRLAGASTDEERDQILRDAVDESRVALNSAATDIRKAITLVRADDPELAAVQRATITAVAGAIDKVNIELSRVVGL